MDRIQDPYEWNTPKQDEEARQEKENYPQAVQELIARVEKLERENKILKKRLYQNQTKHV